jgi:type IV pilus assembly protein PilC
MIFMFTVVVPQFAVLYDQMGNKLPAMTMALLAFGKWLQHNILWICWWRDRASALPLLQSPSGGKDFIDGVRIGCHLRQDLAQVPGGAVCAHAFHAADRRLPLVPSLETAARSISSRRVSKAVMSVDHHGARGQEPGRFADQDRRSFPTWRRR